MTGLERLLYTLYTLAAVLLPSPRGRHHGTAPTHPVSAPPAPMGSHTHPYPAPQETTR